MHRPLEGLRVLDLTRLLPGPLCSLFLADLGAEILKLEAPEGGDYTRWFPPLRSTMSGAFAALNRNKRSLALDLKRKEAIDVVLQILPQIDILLEGFRPGVMDRLGLGYHTLRVHHPRLIYASITGYGQDGPLAHRAGHDINYLARAGLLAMTPSSDDPPSLPGVQIGDIAGGSFAALSSILAAVVRRDRFGQGAFCDISMSESLLSFLVMEMGQRQAAEATGQTASSVLRGTSPCYGLYRCGDGLWLSVGSLEPKFWLAFVQAIGLPHLSGDGLDVEQRGQAVRQEIEARLAEQPRSFWLERLEHADACVEPVLTLEEMPHDPHWKARQAFLSYLHPTEGPSFAPRSPFRLSETPPPSVSPAPSLGQDSLAILRSFGFDETSLQALLQAGVLLDTSL